MKKNKLKGTQTEKNLLTAFSGESQARNKYTFFASQAKKDGFESICKFFLEIADNEKEHAKIWFKYLKDSSLNSTANNLKEAAEGERFEWSKMYKKFSEIAFKEGFKEIGKKFEYVAKIEKNHEEFFLKLLSKLENNKFFTSDEDVIWICSNCGHIHFGKKPPEICPVCEHPKSYFRKSCCR